MGKKILLRFLNEHKFSYFIGILFMLSSSFIQTILPKVLGNIIDILKTNDFNPKRIYINLIYILLIAIGTFVCAYAWRNLVIGNARKLECHLREKLFDHFQILSPEFYSRRKTGDLIAYAINDINAVRMTFGVAISLSINGIVVCVISIYLMAHTINWQYTLLSLLPIPFIVFIMLNIGNIVKKRFTIVQETFASISDRVQENINGIRVIKSYVQEDHEIEKFQKLNSQMMEANLSMVRVSAFLSPLIELSFTICFVINLIYGGNMVLNGTISLGDFIAFNGYLAMILAPVLSIGKVITIYQRGMASLGRLSKILNVNPQVKDGDNAAEYSVKGSIEIKDLSFSFHGENKEVLHNINLMVPEGHTLGIVGETGSGKSTLVNLLLKMFNVEDNKISYGGRDINDFKIDSLRSQFGFVPQDNFLFSASISENIRFFKNIYSQAEVENAAKNSCIYENILEFTEGFDTILGERGVNISGGQKQRISIARALLKNPEILILDDALSSVDTITEAEIIKNISKVRKHKTSIIISHRISAVMEADEIIVLDKGQIAERGTHSQLLLKGGLYSEIYKFQFHEKDRI